MNTADLCPRGLELYTEWTFWKTYRDQTWGGSHMVRTERAEQEAYRKYREHLEDCQLCRKDSE